MGYTITNDEPTPNPRARRLTVDPAPGRIVSCRSRDESTDDPIAAAIMDIDHVESVLVHQTFISVNTAQGAKWNAVKMKIAAALGNVDTGPDDG